MSGKPGRDVSVGVLLAFVFGISGCQTLGSRKVVVQIRDAGGLRGGEAVYMAGIRIGRTGEPRLVNGTANVPVTIYREHKDALLSGSVFLLSPDPNEKPRLAFRVTACSQLKQDKADPDVFAGAPTQIEFIAMCGVEKAKELLQDLAK